MTAALRERPIAPAVRGDDILRVAGICQSYAGGVQVLDNVDLAVKVGEVLALVGENGAGKSTLMKVLAGLIPHGRFTGDVSLRGVPAAFSSVHDAERQGIVLVPQELRIAPDLSVAENMFIGNLPKVRLGLVDFDALERLSGHWLKLFDMTVPPLDKAGRLSTSEQRMVMIAGALSKHASVLLLDEPTAALTDAETQQLFRHVLKLRDQGIGIVLITHRLDEVEQVADRVVVLRNGQVVDRLDGAKGRRREIVRSMIGRDLESVPRRRPDAARPGEQVLAVSELRVEDPDVPGKFRVDGVDLYLRAGEVHGLYGLIGAGRTELGRALFGSWRGRVTGKVDVLGAKNLPASPIDALRRGIAMLTEDRKATGVLDGHSLSTNFSAASLGSISRLGVIRDEAEHSRNDEMLRRLDVRPPRLERTIESLSGGNQQKVLLGRWLNTAPRILILDEPTLGVDVGARFQIYQTISALADQGLAVLMISSDVDEVLLECDRVTVMYKGRISHEFGAERSREDLVAAATGGL